MAKNSGSKINQKLMTKGASWAVDSEGMTSQLQKWRA